MGRAKHVSDFTQVLRFVVRGITRPAGTPYTNHTFTYPIDVPYDVLREVEAVLSLKLQEHGFDSIVATACQEIFARHLHNGISKATEQAYLMSLNFA